jgi:hypothetical protein
MNTEFTEPFATGYTVLSPLHVMLPFGRTFLPR